MMNPRKASTCLRTAYDLLNMMQRIKLLPTDEVSFFPSFKANSAIFVPRSFILDTSVSILLHTRCNEIRDNYVVTGLLQSDDAALWSVQYSCTSS